MNNAPASVLVIAIPEGVELRFPLAGGVSRFLAWFLDLLVIVALCAVATKLLSIFAVLGGTWRQAVTILAYFVISTGYAMLCEWRWRGQTVGKRLFRLRVIDAEGFQLTAAQVVIRNLLRFVDMLPVAYLVGALSATFTKYGQRLGDLAANTVVVRETVPEELRLPDLEIRFNSLAAWPHLVARIRHSASRDLVRLAVETVLRRESLSPAARLALFNEIRHQFETVVSFPEAATEYLTSEQYVRNVLAAISAHSSNTQMLPRLR